MNKSSLSLIFKLLILLPATVMAAPPAVTIDIGGIGPGVDPAAFRTVKRTIGNAVANGIIDKFIVSGYGIEGGFSACAQASPFTTQFPAFVRQLKSIKPNPSTTAYSVNPARACPPPPVVFCPQDAKMCPDGSYVGRVAPSCAFAPCPAK